MAKMPIAGGGFGGVAAAESLAGKLEREHQIVLMPRARKFLFHPALVRLAFGRGEPDDLLFNLREAKTWGTGFRIAREVFKADSV